jgi:hypothetical protein
MSAATASQSSDVPLKQVLQETKHAADFAAARNSELMVELANDERTKRMMSAPGVAKDLLRNRDLIDTQMRKCHELEVLNEGLRRKIQNAKKRHVDQSVVRGGEIVTQENERLLRKQTQILEDRLIGVRAS